MQSLKKKQDQMKLSKLLSILKYRYASSSAKTSASTQYAIIPLNVSRFSDPKAKNKRNFWDTLAKILLNSMETHEINEVLWKPCFIASNLRLFKTSLTRELKQCVPLNNSVLSFILFPWFQQFYDSYSCLYTTNNCLLTDCFQIK